MCKVGENEKLKVETDSAMGVKALGLNVRIGGRDVMITIEEAKLLYHNLREALHNPIDQVSPQRIPVPAYGPIISYPSGTPTYPEILWVCEGADGWELVTE